MKWAEQEDFGNQSFITTDQVKAAVGDKISSEDLLENLNAKIWGFLANCLSGEAETIFKGADDLNGIDA